MNNATEKTPKGAFAYVAPSARVRAEIGYWTKIGDGAVVPATAHLGNWSTVGHFAKVGAFVRFGQWSSVGIDSKVDMGSVLDDHEYVASGYRRTRSGKHVKLSGDPADVAIYAAFDAIARPLTGAFPLEEYAWIERSRREAAIMVVELLPAFLARRKASRRAITGRLLQLFAPANLNHT